MTDTNDLIEKTRNRMSELYNYREENIKIHIVRDLFMKELGYEPNNFSFEEKDDKTANNDRSDMVYIIDKVPLLIVETKGQTNHSIHSTPDLNMKKDLPHLSKYLDSYSKNGKKASWGILTNGTRYVLMNKDINGTIEEQVVFDISLGSTDAKIDRMYLKYFSYENLFEKRTTQFFADVAQYRIYAKKENNSWKQYKSTLYTFFDYYAENNHDYNMKYSNKPHGALSQISVEDFNQYVNAKKAKKIESQRTRENKYSYILSFFKTLLDYGYIDRSQFILDRKRGLSDFNDTPKQKSENHLTAENFQIILNFIYNNSKEKYRDMAVFLLCSYYGLERILVNSLKWNNIDTNKRTMTIENRIYEINDLLNLSLNELQKEKKKNKNRSEYVITASYHDRGCDKVNETTINRWFDKLKKIDADNDMWSDFSPQYVRKCLIFRMFEAGFSIEQIAYYTGLDLIKLANYIPIDVLFDEGKKRLKKGIKQKARHPFESVVNDFYEEIII